MRPLIIAFLILSPFIAVAQNYHLHAQLPTLTHVPARLAQTMINNASMKMGNMVHEVHELLS